MNARSVRILRVTHTFSPASRLFTILYNERVGVDRTCSKTILRNTTYGNSLNANSLSVILTLSCWNDSILGRKKLIKVQNAELFKGFKFWMAFNWIKRNRLTISSLASRTDFGENQFRYLGGIACILLRPLCSLISPLCFLITRN